VDSVAVTSHDLTQPGVQDTMAFGATVSFCWECEDVDGPVVSHSWDVGGFLQGSTAEGCIDTDSVCAFDPDSGFVVCESRPYAFPGTFLTPFVKGRDAYGRVPATAPTITLQFNFAPSVTIDPPTGPIHANTPVEFFFHGFDRDSDPEALRYRWWFDTDLPPGSFYDFPPGSTPHTGPEPADPDAPGEFELFQVGTHSLKVQAVDQSDLDRPSRIETLVFDVAP
jgi:hypothetical protein